MDKYFSKPSEVCCSKLQDCLFIFGYYNIDLAYIGFCAEYISSKLSDFAKIDDMFKTVCKAHGYF